MTFNINQLNRIDPAGERGEQALEKYQDALLELFGNSPEGQERLKADPGMGFWAAQLMHYGYNYEGITIPKMTVGDVNQIVTGMFPRKISLHSPDDADDAIPELVAFWQFLKREYRLPRANAILELLHEIEPEFKEIMTDPANFGMAKSFLMMGQQAGYDMTNQDDANAFIQHYNANIIAQDPDLQPSLPPRGGLFDLFSGALGSSGDKKARAKKKKNRQMAKASRGKKRKKRRRR